MFLFYFLLTFFNFCKICSQKSFKNKSKSGTNDDVRKLLCNYKYIKKEKPNLPKHLSRMSPILIPVSGTLLFVTGLSCLSFSFSVLEGSVHVSGGKAFTFYILLSFGMFFNLIASFPILFHLTKKNIKVGALMGSIATLLIFVADIFAILLYNESFSNRAEKTFLCLAWVISSVYLFVSIAFVFFSCLTLFNSIERRMLNDR